MAAVLDARRSRFLLVGLVLLHLVAISHQVDGGGGASLLQRAIFGLFTPLQNAVSAVVRGISGAWTGYRKFPIPSKYTSVWAYTCLAFRYWLVFTGSCLLAENNLRIFFAGRCPRSADD